MNRDAQATPPLYITLGYLRGLFEYLRVRQLPLRPVLAAMGLDQEELPDLDLRVVDVAEDHAFLAAERLTGDANIGLHVGRNQQPINLGILGYLLMTCTRMSEVFDLHLRYSQLIGNATYPEYRTAGDSSCLVLHRQKGAPPHCRHSIEFAFSGYTHLARWISDQRFQPTLIEFQHAAPVDAGEQRDFFRCPLRFGCAENRMHFDTAQIELPLLRGDATLHQALEREACKRLQLLREAQTDADPQLARLKQYVAQRLMFGVPDIAAAAVAMGLPVRRLQRDLEARRTNYRKLVESVRLQLAEHYARDATLSLVDVAMMLGFSEQSAFQRAFRRWFNTTPGDYRKARS